MRILSAALTIFALASACCTSASIASPAAEVVSFSQPGLTANQLGVIVNDEDPDSISIAAYYQDKRGIPEENLIHVRFRPGSSTMSKDEFNRIKREVDKASGNTIQAYALTWAQPYRVDCMSITSAFAFGFDESFCASGCKPTRPSPYFNSTSSLPYTHHKIRPAISLAATNVKQAKKLIDRGVAADEKNPDGTAYLVSTSDASRNVRARGFEKTRELVRRLIPAEIVKTEALRNKRDVMFYFTGRATVADIDTNAFLPGAMADHLTSAGGALFDSSQMSSLKWLEAGATGSYGAVMEPCNFLEKFPVPAIAMSHYLQGDTLIEAYWKSVAMPGQGIFIGEPLARPFSGFKSEYNDGQLKINMRVIEPGAYSVQFSTSMIGPFRETGRFKIGSGVREIRLNNVQPGYYRFENIARKLQQP